MGIPEKLMAIIKVTLNVPFYIRINVGGVFDSRFARIAFRIR